MKLYSDLRSRNSAATWIFQPRQIALFAAVLGCLLWSASHANAQAVSSVSCQSSSFSSAATDACTVTLSSVAQSQIPVYLYSSDPALTVPGVVYVNAGATSAAFSAGLASVSSARWVWITAQASSAMATKVTFGIQLSPPAPAALQVSSVSCQTSSFTSAGTDACTVNLNGSAQSQTAVYLYSSDPALTLPAVVYVSAGQSSVAFTAGLASVSSSRTVWITAQASTAMGTKATYGIQLSPPAPAPLQVSSVSCQTSSFTSAGTDACTVTLNRAAQTQTAVYLYSSDSALTLPGVVYVDAGASSVAFSAGLASVSSARWVWITAEASSAMGTKVTCGIQLSPAAQNSALSVSSSSLAFGSVNVGQTVTKNVTLTSSGTSAVTISSISVSGAQFTATGITTPLALNPGQSATLTLSFYAASSSSFTGSVTIANSSSQGKATVSLSGAGVPALGGLTCNSQSFTGSGADSCLVSLNGTATGSGFVVALASNNSSVSIPSSITVPSGAMSASFTAQVASVSTSQSASLTASANGVSKTCALQLSATVPTLTVNASTVPFGNVVLNSRASQSVTLTSAGGAPVVISSISASGAGFTTSGIALPLTLNPGQTAILNIQFAPTLVQSYTGQVTISSNSANGSVAVGLTGTGFTHNVALTWVAPSSNSDPVAGYNLYRMVSGSTSYTKLNTSLLSATTYSDANVSAGTTYDYYVTSVDGSGHESVPSGTTQASVPTP